LEHPVPGDVETDRQRGAQYQGEGNSSALADSAADLDEVRRQGEVTSDRQHVFSRAVGLSAGVEYHSEAGASAERGDDGSARTDLVFQVLRYPVAQRREGVRWDQEADPC
jgi:hypothetical protein